MKFTTAFIGFSFLMVAWRGETQHLSREGRFQVQSAGGCAPFSIQIQELDNFGNISRQYIYEEGLPETDRKTHTFNNPGVYRVVQIVGVDIDPKTDTLVIRVTAPQPVDFELYQCRNKQIFIEIDDDFYDRYEVVPESGVSLISDGNLPVEYVFFQNGAKEIAVRGIFEQGAGNCGFFTKSITVEDFQNRGEIQQILASRTCLTELSVNIMLRTDVSQQYQMQYRVDNNPYITIHQGVLSDALSLESIDIEGSDELCFRLNALSPCDNEIRRGEDRCMNLRGFNPDAFANARASYLADGIQILFDPVGEGSFDAARLIRGFDFEPMDTLFKGFVDTDISPIREYEYRFSFTDPCQNRLPNVTVAPPYIKAGKREVNQFIVSWENPINNIQEDFRPTLVLSGNGETLEITNPGMESRVLLSEKLGRSQQIQLRLEYPQSGITVLSNPVTAFYEYRAYLPDAFTPNGDGLNDRLIILGIEADEFDFKVYNRWGELIYLAESKSEFWDGNIGNREAPQGTYLYRLTYATGEGELITQQGTFVLLRK